jgi:hypothetical protein
MNSRLDAGCLLLAALLLVNGVQRARSIGASDPMGPPMVRVGSVNAPTLPNADSLDDAAATIVANNPFRLSNKPASARFTTGVPGVPQSAPARPQLTLKAIIGGPPWSAIVEGIPGEAGGIVVASGMTFDKLHIRGITRDTVVLQGSDTTWKLTMKATP